jgi:hypothetical protein
MTRFSEPSTWAGLGILFQVLAQSFEGVNPDLSIIFHAFSGGAGSVAVLLREKP